MLPAKRIKKSNDKNKESGFTLVELMIAVFVLSVGILAMMIMQVTSIRTNSSARRLTESAVVASDRIEKLMRVSYQEVESGKAEAGRYTITWTVSDPDDPIKNVRTIDVTVSTIEAGQERSTRYVYYKADQI
jgi:type IV pilus modification protein PilV